MSGSMFITGTGAADDAFDRSQRRFQQARKEEEQRGVDAALRRGISQIGQQPQDAPAAAPAGPPPAFTLPGTSAPQPMAASIGATPSVGQTTSGGGQYTSLLNDAAGRHRVDTGLAGRMMQQESGGNPSAVSPRGARGLMQLMPGTAAELGVDPNDPAQNVEGGMRYYRQMLDRYGGNEQHALAAYNWGPGNVDKWVAAGADPARLPAETRAYLQRVSTNGGASQNGRASSADFSAAAGIAPPATGTPANMAGGQPAMDTRSDYDPILRELAGVQGGGAAAITLLGQRATDQRGRQQFAIQQARSAQQDKNRMATLAMTALGRGDLTTYQYWARQAGIPEVPPEVQQNAEMRGLLSQASILATRHYGDDPQQAQVFLKAYMESRGNAVQALEAAGLPRSKPNYQAQWIQTDAADVQRLVFFDRNNPNAAPVIPGQGQQPAAQPGAQPAAPPAAPGGAGAIQPPASGQPAAPQPGAAPAAPAPAAPSQQGYTRRTPGTAGTGARMLDREARRQMLIAGGMSEREAALVAGGAAPSANAILSYHSRAQALVGNDIDLIGKPEEQAAKVERMMESVFGPGWRGLVNRSGPAPAAAAPAAPAAGAPAAPAAAPPAEAPAARAAPPTRPPSVPQGSQYSPSRQQWRDRNGKLYDAQGNPA